MHPRSSSHKRLMGALALACVTGAVALAVLPATASTGATARRCATSDLVIWLNTAAGGAAAGTSYYDLELTNLSGRACTLHGYPGVSAVNLVGAQIGSAAARDSVYTPHTVTLARTTAGDYASATATVVLGIATAGNYPRPICVQTTAAGLRVFPPGQRAWKVVPFPFIACSRKGPAILHVQAVQAGIAPGR